MNVSRFYILLLPCMSLTINIFLAAGNIVSCRFIHKRSIENTEDVSSGKGFAAFSWHSLLKSGSRSHTFTLEIMGHDDATTLHSIYGQKLSIIL